LKKTKLSKSTGSASKIVSHTPLSCIYILGKTCLLEIRRGLLILLWLLDAVVRWQNLKLSMKH
jgi:hypothetical protein